jgi:DNA mismatch repair protein MutS2
LNLIGRRVDEALDAVDKFLDQASLADCDQVRLIHGYGSGRLRAGIRRFLDGHRQVRRWRPGGAGEGDDGATVVELH